MTLFSSMRGMMSMGSRRRRSNSVEAAAPVSHSPARRSAAVCSKEKSAQRQPAQRPGRAGHTPKESLPGAVFNCLAGLSPAVAVARLGRASPINRYAHKTSCCTEGLATLVSTNSTPTTVAGSHASPLSSSVDLSSTSRSMRSVSSTVSAKSLGTAVSYFSDSEQRCGKRRPTPQPLRMSA